jgi:hypothetical protein
MELSKISEKNVLLPFSSQAAQQQQQQQQQKKKKKKKNISEVFATACIKSRTVSQCHQYCSVVMLVISGSATGVSRSFSTCITARDSFHDATKL